MPIPAFLIGYIDILWIAFIVMTFLVAMDPLKSIFSLFGSNFAFLQMATIGQHGKLMEIKRESKIASYLFVPKRYFAQFYVVGTFFTSMLIIGHMLAWAFMKDLQNEEGSLYCCLPLLMFLLHCSRR